ncbi:MAG TPA: adenylate/guanylate cyclase domain-containing protein [Gammaproteobacteria bacterium]|nr:adenylate/guanylate cyclase domain-containing protein [Gammaproteobacteria bacterium]
MTRASITVLFSDIADSTSLYSALGDVPGRETVGQALRLMEAVIEAADGRVIKTLGDEIMAVFDAAPQAARAATTMQERITERKSKMQPPLAIRVGMHTGMALVEEGDVYGDVVNTAARITSLAKPEQILATDATVAALDDSWRDHIHELGPHTIRGKRGPVELCEIVWSRADMTVIVAPPEELGGTTRKGPTLVLRLGSSQCMVSSDRPRCTAGRSARNDLVVSDHYASRLHVEIEYRAGKFVLTDRSTNGTYIEPEDGEEIILRRDRTTLEKSGTIGLGRPPEAEPDLAIEFRLEGIEEAEQM